MAITAPVIPPIIPPKIPMVKEAFDEMVPVLLLLLEVPDEDEKEEDVVAASAVVVLDPDDDVSKCFNALGVVKLLMGINSTHFATKACISFAR